LQEAQLHRLLLEGHALRHVLGNGLPAAATTVQGQLEENEAESGSILFR